MEYRLEHKNEIKEYQHRYYIKNKSKILEIAKNRRNENNDEYSVSQKRYYHRKIIKKCLRNIYVNLERTSNNGNTSR